jgi:glucose/arabinose dehydrogenase
VKRPARLAVFGLLAAVAVTACGGSDDDSTAGTTSTASPANTTTTATPASSPPTGPVGTSLEGVAIDLQKIATVADATALAPRSGDSSLYVTSRGGTIRRITVTTDAETKKVTYALEPGSVLDIRSKVVTDGQEQGLLCITFSTDGQRLYIAYTGEDSRQYLDEYHMSDTKVDTRSRRNLLTIDDFASNHNGGQLLFGPDGFLYYGMGDGGGGGDPANTGQNPNDLLGNILRIDPEGSTGDLPYGIPDGNPFRDGGGAPEVFAYGLRNPWRFAFDRQSADLWIGDVGQGEWEEIDFLPATPGQVAGVGANLGWSALEGSHPYNGQTAPGSILPIYEYNHAGGACSVTGGFVYRGEAIPDLDGVYLFADFCVGDIYGLVQEDGAAVTVQALDQHVDSPSSFGEDNDGELYVLSLGGDVYKITAG